MIKTDIKLTHMLMTEMGLTEGNNHRIIDREDGEICCVGTKEVVSPGYFERGTIECDPINNSKLMNTLFMGFIDKLEDEELLDDPCISFGTYGIPGSDKNVARITFESGQVMESRPYKTEGLCYVELAKRLNGDEESADMTRYDRIKRTPVEFGRNGKKR